MMVKGPFVFETQSSSNESLKDHQSSTDESVASTDEWLNGFVGFDSLPFENDYLLGPNSANSAAAFHLSSNTHSTTAQSKVKRKNSKRPSSNPVFMPALRILKRDIRRKYGPMMMNVANSHDNDLMRQFLLDFALPNLLLQDEMLFEAKVFPFRMNQLHGLDAILNHLRLNFLLMPDSVLRMSDIKVCQRLGAPGSRVVAITQLNGTLLHEESKESSSTKPSQLVVPLSTPYDIVLQGIMTMQLDENHRIASMTWTAHQLREEPIPRPAP